MEYDIDDKDNLLLTFYDWEDFLQEEYSKNQKYYKKLKRLLDNEFTKKSGFKFINNVEFNKTIKSADALTTWIDYLRVSIDSPITYFSEILDNLDYENSNFFIDTDNYITWAKIRLNHWPAIIGSIVYEWVSVPVLLYNEFDDHNQQMLKSFWKIDFYGAYRRLIELWFLEPNFVEKLIRTKDSEDMDILLYSNITRLDYKIDLFYKKKVKIPHYKKLLKIRKNSKIWNKHISKTNIKEEVLKWEELQSWAYGSKSAKRVFLRVYDKLADTEAKWKYMLYQDYYNYESVYRIEFELLNHFCKWYKYVDYQDLVEKFWNSIDVRYLGKVFYDYNSEPNLEAIEKRIRYFKDFIWRWERIAEKGFNPFLILYKGLQNNWKIKEDKLVDLVFDLYSYVWEWSC